MSFPTNTHESTTDSQGNPGDHVDPSPPNRQPKRINVAITPDTVRALELVMENEGVTLTEALRRLVGYGDFVYRQVREGAKVLVQTDDTIREVVLL